MSLKSPGPAAISDLRARLPETCFKKPGPHYLTEPRGLIAGQAAMVIAPEKTAQIAEIVGLANKHRFGIVPFGGGTGLVGGQVCDAGPAVVVVSMERLDRIRMTDPSDNVLICEGGVILADIQMAAAKADRLFPLSLASEGSCQIGGNLATNAGGTGVLRYGSARDLCLGIEAVLPDGSIWNGLGRLRKDNSGYDLKNLMIGAEGTLGIITAASLKLVPRPAVTRSVFCEIRDPAAALELLARCHRTLGDTVSAFELISRQGFDFVAEKLPQLRLPFAVSPNWMVLADFGWPEGSNDDSRLLALLEDAVAAGLCGETLVSQNAAQRREFWALREAIPEANRLIGAIGSHDISVPLNQIPAMITQGKRLVAALGDFRVNVFGHVGDGNLHFNVYPPKGRARVEYAAQRPEISAAIYDLVAELGGSFAAEHGIGRVKLDALRRFGDPAKLAMMRSIKAALDPNGIMNPGAVVPAPV